MKNLLRRVLLGAVLAAMIPALALAAGSGNAIIGSWKLNVAKSQYNPGPPPRSLVRTYKESRSGYILNYDGADSDGNPTVGSHTINLDGKEYPEAEAPDYDTASSRQIDRFTYQTLQHKAGKLVATLTYTVAQDGKTMTLRKEGVDAKGVAFRIVAIYDRV